MSAMHTRTQVLECATAVTYNRSSKNPVRAGYAHRSVVSSCNQHTKYIKAPLPVCAPECLSIPWISLPCSQSFAGQFGSKLWLSSLIKIISSWRGPHLCAYACVFEFACVCVRVCVFVYVLCFCVCFVFLCVCECVCVRLRFGPRSNFCKQAVRAV